MKCKETIKEWTLDCIALLPRIIVISIVTAILLQTLGRISAFAIMLGLIAVLPDLKRE